MENIEKLKKAIAEIGNRLVGCRKHCAGVAHGKSDDIVLPRYLVLETEERTRQRGSVIVGINPGQIWRDETEYYKEHGTNYETMVDYWRIRIMNLKYYTWLKRIPDNLGLRGPILWTELVKCTSKVKGTLPPLETFRICISNFLSKELESVPRSWPLIAAGKYVYQALAFRFPNRIVIGVPHPTGSYGHFQKLFSKLNNKKMLKVFKPELRKMWSSGCGKAAWLNAKRKRIE